jgi:hypothetical protein
MANNITARREKLDQVPAENLYESIRIGESLQALIEHPGYKDFIEELERKARSLQKLLMQKAPTDVAAEYASKVGEMNGLRQAREAIDAAVERGRKAETELRRREDRQSA